MKKTLSAEEQKTIVVITGPSGAGKTSVIDQLVKDHPELKKVICITTRKQRDDEIDGYDRNFVDNKTFLEMENNGDLACIKNDGTNKYAIPKKLDDGNFHIIDLDPYGLENLKKEFSANIISIALYQPQEVCEERMEERDGLKNQNDIQRRLRRDSERFADIDTTRDLVSKGLINAICCPKDATVKATADAIWNMLNTHLLEHII